MNDTNPFSRALRAPPRISVFMGRTAVPAASSEDRAWLVGLAAFDWIQLTFEASATLGPEWNDTSAIRGSIRLGGDHVSFHSDGGAWLVGPRQVYEHLTADPNTPADAAVEWMVARSGNAPDYVVGSARAVDQATMSLPRYVTIDELRSTLRLLLIAHERFEFRPRFFVDGPMYYMYRRDLLFPEYRRAWLRVRHDRNAIERRLEGMGTRLEFICRAADAVLVASRATPGTAAESDALFYLVMQYLLSTGVYDDIASIICAAYDVTLSRTQITLRETLKGRSTVAEAVETKNPELTRVLRQPQTVAYVSALYPIRDALQHREMPIAVGRMTARRGWLPSAVVIPETAAQLLASAFPAPEGSIRSWADAAGNVMVDVAWVTSAGLEALRRVVDTILPLLPVEALPSDLDPNTSTLHLLEEFNSNGPAAFLGLGSPPTIL